jgi:hypothetical protein
MFRYKRTIFRQRDMPDFKQTASALAIGFKPGILCSFKMVRFYRNMSELRV